VRNSSGQVFSYLNIDSLISFHRDGADGPAVPFDAVINTEKTKVYISLKSALEPSSVYYLSMSGDYEDYRGNKGNAVTALFHTVDLTSPSVMLDPADGSTDVPLNAVFKLEFSEPVRLSDNSDLSPENVIPLIDFRKDGPSGTQLSCTAEISSDHKIITILPSAELESNTGYYLRVFRGFEDYYNNPADTAVSLFTTFTFWGIAQKGSLLSIYPNPGNGIFNLSLKTEERRTYSICDLNGKILVSGSMSGRNSLVIDLSAYPAGIYILSAGPSGNIGTEKFKLIKL
jgi:hypothetical protein